MEPSEIFGRALRRERELAGLSQEALADTAGMHTTEISRLERAVRDPRLSTIVRLSRALGVRPTHLLQDVE